MRRLVVLLTLVGLTALLASGRASAFLDESVTADQAAPGPSAVLSTASVSAATLPADPDVVTAADLATAGAQPATMHVSSDGDQLVVDDDLAQCPDADFTTPTGIQQAIEAAPPGGKIKVCPGTYSPINVHKPELWLQAPRTHGEANQCRVGDPKHDAFIRGSHVLGLVQITASGVQFEGFIVEGNSSGPGVRTDSTGSGYELSFNEIRLNDYGIDLNTNGLAETEISHSCIRDNTGSAGGIASSSGFSNVVIANNMLAGAQEAIFNCRVPFDFPPTCFPSADVEIVHNDFVDTGSTILGGATDVTVSYNTFLRPLGAAVILSNVVGAEVSFNHVDGQDVEPTQGISIGSDTSIALDTIVKSNKVENVGADIRNPPFFPFLIDGFGIAVNGAGVTVLENWIQFNRGTGISLRARSDGNIVRGNLLVGNGIPGTDLFLRGSDGIRIQPGAVGNTIENNRLGEPLHGNDPAERANRDHDCHDDNPSGANAWRHNVGYTENQPGLCVRRTA